MAGFTSLLKNPTYQAQLDQARADMQAKKAAERSGLARIESAKERLVSEGRIPGYTRSGALDYKKNAFGMPGTTATGLKESLKLGSFDPRGIEAIRGEALRAPGQDSPWATMALQRQGFEEQQGLNQAGRQFAGANAQAMSQLQRSGGMSGGARERLAAQSARNQALGMQDVRAQGIGQRSDVRLQDEQNRQKWLEGLAGQEAAYQAPQRFNIQNELQALTGEATRKSAYDLGKYGMQTDALSKLIQGKAAEDAANQGKK